MAPPAAAASPAPPRVEARTAVVMDAATGAVLWQRQAHRPVLVASTTKILTAIVASDGYPASKVLRVPLAAERVDGTRFGYKTGWRIRRDRLLTTLLLVSANDSAETLAAAGPGSCGPWRPSAPSSAAPTRPGVTRRAWTPPATGPAPPTWPSSAGPCWSGRCWPSWSGRGP
jgi:hypothetical protein